jgi:predicted O-methyltransferase YrrM
MLTAVANGAASSLGRLTGAESWPVCRLRRFNHWVDEIYYEGGWEVGPLRDQLTGHISTGGEQSVCTFTVEGEGLILRFWSHPWSGVALVEIDGAARTVDLFGVAPGMKNVHFDGLAAGVHVVRISSIGRTEDTHPGDQIVFHEAIAYERLLESVTAPVQKIGARKPGRFNAIYHAPGGLGWAERALLYATVFGARPQNMLTIGRGQTGTALIAVAALDDAGGGDVTCVDPDPDCAPEYWQKIGHRTAFVVGRGIDAVANARARSGADFDFAFLDFAEPGLIPDWNTLATLLCEGAPILAHNATPAFLRGHGLVIDGGELVSEVDGVGGLRLLRMRK